MIELISPYIGMALALFMIIIFNYFAQAPKGSHKRHRKDL